ncbi:hypothetical protein PCANB_002699 [Pneumocystis canis]|nr:hypothetical protein PCANB_002699 [Pneumocystis canis]
MSRIIVKNLPKYLNENRFKDYFSSYCGEHITDIRFVRSKDGKFRGFGFIGYKTKEDALNAIKYYHNTFVDMSKICVEYARDVDFTALESRGIFKCDDFFVKDCDYEKNNKSTIDDVLLNRETQKNEELYTCFNHSETKICDKLLKVNQQTLIRNGEFENCKNDSIDVNNHSSCLSFVPDVENGQKHSFSYICPENMKQKCECSSLYNSKKPFNMVSTKLMTDNEWLRSKTKQITELSDDQFGSDKLDEKLIVKNDCHHEKNIPECLDKNKTTLKNEILLSGRLFVRNLPYSISEMELRNAFEEYGKLVDVHIPFDFSSNMSKGFAYILFENPLSAVNAYEKMDGRALYGRLIHILPAQIKRDFSKSFTSNEVKFKEQRIKRRKMNAYCSQFSWNSLYMNPDAVVSSVADRFGLSKDEVLDPTSSNAAIKQALAETYVIEEAKAFFEKSGVNLDSFSVSERDEYVLLVKNFSYGTTVSELSELFGKYGTLSRVLMPPSGTIAIVEFMESKNADYALKQLSYRKFKDSILYLEKAPLNIFKDKFCSKINLDIMDSGLHNSKAVYDIDINNENYDIADTERTTLFIKNLNFLTTIDSLRSAFCSLDGFINAIIKTKPDLKRPGNKLSMGFGFVEFRTRSQALSAMHVMKDYVLDGHVLQIKESHKSCGFSENNDMLNKNVCKIIIKNLPFETTKKDIRQLFGSYGELKSVRVPKKIDNSIRGFAFVEYATSRDAKNAFNILKNTHLLGRHLILEWASDKSIIDDLKTQHL